MHPLRRLLHRRPRLRLGHTGRGRRHWPPPRGEDVDRFSRRYVRQVGVRYSLIEKPGGDCIFWDKGSGCTVYEARPVQCRTWPFWAENVESPAAWAEVGGGCPGVDRGRVYTVEEIVASVARTPD